MASVSNTHVRSESEPSPAALATRSVNLSDHCQLFVPVEGARVGQHLDPHVPTITVNVGQRAVWQLVDERRRVLSEHGDVGDPFDDHEGTSEVGGELVR